MAGLALLLVLILGLSGMAHAFAKSCSGGHCDPEVGVSIPFEADLPALSHPEQYDTEADHDGCNPSLCHVVALVQEPISLSQTDEFLRYVGDNPSLRRLSAPEDKDRPPRL